MGDCRLQLNPEVVLKDHLTYITKICAGFAQNKNDLDDLVQEVSIKVFKGLGSFTGRSKLTTWIYRVTVNVCLYQISKKTKTEDPREHFDLIRRIESIPADHTENDMISTLYRGITQLKPVDRAIIMLYLEKSTHDEIAEIMGMTPSNIGVRINRTKKQLKQIIDEQH